MTPLHIYSNNGTFFQVPEGKSYYDLLQFNGDLHNFVLKENVINDIAHNLPVETKKSLLTAKAELLFCDDILYYNNPE